MQWMAVTVEFIVGLGLLAWGAHSFVDASVVLARNFKMPPLIIGMLLIGFGTSLPELVVAILASLHHAPEIAVGNVLGSNIANKALVGGVAALLTPLTIHSRVLRREFPFLIAVTIVVGVLFWNESLSVVDGVILLALFVVYLFWMFYQASHVPTSDDEMLKEIEQEVPTRAMKSGVAVFWFLLGLGLLLGSSELVVQAATWMARAWHVSDLVIGLTVVAIGTSLPELAATVVSSMRKEYDLAIGNVVGSSIFNLLVVLPMPAIIAPGPLSSSILSRDYPMLLFITVLFWLLGLCPPLRGRINRLSGGVMVFAYVTYVAVLIYSLAT